MSVPLLLDSKDRDRTEFANPAEFNVDMKQTAGWSSLMRDVLCVRPCSKKDACNLLFCIRLLVLTLPGAATDSNGGNLPESQPYIFVRLSSSLYPDKGLIRNIDSTTLRGANDATFVCVLERLQGGASEWLQYKCTMNQCIRLDATKPQLEFRVFTREGNPAIPLGANGTNTVQITDNALPAAIDPTLQVNALFEITPYVRDNDYANHLIELFPGGGV